MATAKEGGPEWADGVSTPRISGREQRKWCWTAGRSVRGVAGELGINHETLRNWVAAERRERADGPAALTADERMELARLWRKVAELELEREILKKAAAFFARETGR